MEKTLSHLLDPQHKIDPDQLVILFEKIIDNQKALMSKVDSIEGQLSSHISTTKEQITEVISGFPGGDVEGHKRYHDLQIQMLEEKRSLRIAIQEKTISGLIWSALVFVAIAVWHSIKESVFK